MNVRVDGEFAYIWKKLPREVLEWVTATYSSESMSPAGVQDVFVGAWDYGADTVLIKMAANATFGQSLGAGPGYLALPLREYENEIARVCVELWKQGVSGVVFSNWHGTELRGVRVFDVPGRGELTRGRGWLHFSIENQVLLGLIEVKKSGNAKLFRRTSDAESAMSMLTPRSQRN